MAVVVTRIADDPLAVAVLKGSLDVGDFVFPGWPDEGIIRIGAHLGRVEPEQIEQRAHVRRQAHAAHRRRFRLGFRLGIAGRGIVRVFSVEGIDQVAVHLALDHPVGDMHQQQVAVDVQRPVVEAHLRDDHPLFPALDGVDHVMAQQAL